MNTATSKVAGEPELWDEKWVAIGTGPNAKLYTRGRAISAHQLYHKLYYHDISIATAALTGDPKYCELGAGRGTTAQYLTIDGCDVTMVDLSETGFALAARNFAQEGLRPPKCVLADVCETGLPDEEFDCVYSIGLLEHFDQPQTVLIEAMRILKPGGVFFHTILDGDVIHSKEFHRTNCKAERYEALAIESGASQAACQPYRIQGVHLLSGVK